MKNIIYILSFFTILSCKTNSEEEIIEPEISDEIQITQKQFSSNNMTTVKLQEVDFADYIKATGKIDVATQYRAKIASILGGYVIQSSVIIGDKVKKGQVLATLENTEIVDIQKEFIEIAERINFLKSEYNRQKTLFDEKITSQKNYLKAESEYKEALGTYNSLREKLIIIGLNPNAVAKGTISKTLFVTSPINGIVTQNNASLGAFISGDNTIVEVVDPSQLVVNLAIFERDVMRLKENQPILFKVTEVSNETFSSEVFRIAKVINEENRTVTVYGSLQDSLKQKLVAGMFVEAKIIANNRKVLALPNEAIFEENDKKMILLVDKSDKNSIIFKKQEVFTGIKNEQFTEILPESKVSATSEILEKGVYDVVE
ncbi:efflux RND transporter periplasmic adaptor subunit [Flavobacterium sp.]|uniref:efflux RND transporter periplasmic adaptor subunit n=1 Tax=Flavobacterium sp. TaxID=239 RepID=UPI0035272CC0